MRESLAAANRQFEQVILADMLRTAGLGKRVTLDSDDDAHDDDGAFADQSGRSDDAFGQLIVQALSGAIERAGGIGLQRALLRETALAQTSSKEGSR